MKKHDIDQIDVNELSEDELIGLPRMVYRALAKKMAAEQHAESRSRIDYLPRDWLTNIDDKDMSQIGPLGEGITYIPHLIIRSEEGIVEIYGWYNACEEPFEMFRTREKLDSFIEALTQIRDNVFNQ